MKEALSGLIQSCFPSALLRRSHRSQDTRPAQLSRILGQTQLWSNLQKQPPHSCTRSCVQGVFLCKTPEGRGDFCIQCQNFLELLYWGEPERAPHYRGLREHVHRPTDRPTDARPTDRVRPVHVILIRCTCTRCQAQCSAYRWFPNVN